MTIEKYKVKVIFLIDRVVEVEDYPSYGGDVYAYFPGEDESPGMRVCYAHIGQHSGCSPDYAKECKLAKPEEYADLKRELENIGYELRILKTKRSIR